MLYGYGYVNNHMPTLQSTVMGKIALLPLLDTYSGSSAAYSLRKLRSAYTGYAVRVRRSSDSVSQDIGFNSNGTLDTTSLLSFVGANYGYVTIWYDQSGNAYDLSTTIASYQPEIVSSGSLITTLGKPTLRFGAVSGGVTFLENTSFSINSPNISFLYVANKLSAGTSKNDLSIALSFRSAGVNDYNNLNNIGTRIQNDNTYRIYYNSISYQDSYNYNTNYLIWNQKIGNQISLSKNGGTLLTTTAGSSSNITSSIISLGGASAYTIDSNLNGYLSEAIVYPSDQTTNRLGISTNINTHYSIY